MHTTINRNRLYAFIARTAAVTFLSAAATLGLQAQQSPGTAPPLPPVSLKSTLTAPIDLSTPDALKYSSSTGSAEMANAEVFDLGSDIQPPPRRRYGRPNYSDSHTNPDGSAKYNFIIGGGLTLPVGGTHNYLAPSYNIQGAVARNFSKTLGIQAEFDWANFGFQTSTLNNQLAIYNGPFFLYGLPQIGGATHIWSFSLNPIVNFYTSDTWGAYVIGGGGFYHKVATFTTPVVAQMCDPYYGCYNYQANQPIDSYTSNALGVNGGIGFTYKASRFSSIRFFAEGRYIYTFNSKRAFDYGDVNFNNVNVFPQNSAKTGYVPITLGVRF
ncbi:MAG: hypothetical protein ABI286_05910 [Edaphobacter sp.]